MLQKKLLLSLTLFLTVAAHTQVKNLVFEGAGVRGIAYCGAIQVLEEKKLLQNIRRVGGTSAGAITALTVSLGYTANEIEGLINSTPFQKFNDGRFFFLGGMNRMYKYYGWYRGRRFEDWLGDIIEAKTGDGNITFAELKERGFKELFITGTSLNRQSAVVFSYESFPRMRIKDAVRISLSIPLYFEAVFMDENGSTYSHPKMKAGLDVMADGGFTANFPMRLFDSTKYFDASKENNFFYNQETIGIRIDSDQQIKNDSTGGGLAYLPVENFRQYITAFYTIVLENLNRQTLTTEDWARTVSISDGEIGPRIRKLSSREKGKLIDNGRKSMARYLDVKNPY